MSRLYSKYGSRRVSETDKWIENLTACECYGLRSVFWMLTTSNRPDQIHRRICVVYQRKRLKKFIEAIQRLKNGRDFSTKTASKCL